MADIQRLERDRKCKDAISLYFDAKDDVTLAPKEINNNISKDKVKVQKNINKYKY